MRARGPPEPAPASLVGRRRRQGGRMRLSELPAEHVTRLFFLAQEHFRGCGYIDAWLLGISGDAWSRGDRNLARECLSAFAQGRVFFALEADILNSLWSLFGAPAETVDDEPVFELAEA
jgi:hypothetical protein